MNPSLISVHLGIRQRKEERIMATPLVSHGCMPDGDQTDGAPLSQAEVVTPSIMTVISSYLSYFVINFTQQSLYGAFNKDGRSFTSLFPLATKATYVRDRG